MIQVISFLTLFTSISMFASSFGIKKKSYHCQATGKTYDVLITETHGWYNWTWETDSFCRQGIANQDYYNREMGGSLAGPEVRSCQQENSPGTETCYYEYARSNPTKGEGPSPEIFSQGTSSSGELEWPSDLFSNRFYPGVDLRKYSRKQLRRLRRTNDLPRRNVRRMYNNQYGRGYFPWGPQRPYINGVFRVNGI